MRLSRHKTHRRSRCSNHTWEGPVLFAGMARRLCVRCGEISLESLDQPLTVPASLRVPVGAR